MKWVELRRDAAKLECVYCRTSSQFPHFRSFEYFGNVFHLHRCPGCDSLIYDPAALGPIAGVPLEDHESRLGTKYYFEVGFDAGFIVRCVLSALPNDGSGSLRGLTFIDIGAGNGLGSFFAREAFTMPVFSLEPSLTGEAARTNFNLPLMRKTFEELDPAEAGTLHSRPCVLHLNSVIEHLGRPFELLERLVSAIDVRQIAAVVPNGAEIDIARPFVLSLPFLAPGDHLHLPTPKAMEKMFSDLGFDHCTCTVRGELFIAIGSREPLSPPSEREVALGSELLLTLLAVHDNPAIAKGAQARLFPGALIRGNKVRLDQIRTSLTENLGAPNLLAALRVEQPWTELPFYSGMLSYWLAVDAHLNGNPDLALLYLDVVEAFAARITATYPQYSLEPVLYRWEAALLRAQFFKAANRLDEARALLWDMLSSKDAVQGPPAEAVRRARHTLDDLERSVAAEAAQCAPDLAC